ncbi:fimbrial protein [Citrobacter sp. FP75]|uniref:fimbrial protein n=1 Tax=Citrobacter sp. FP75 TaxID=1852949 RepID=UPI001FD4CED2|nr:fimbrial protein [Citrobacter sp. FP75]
MNNASAININSKIFLMKMKVKNGIRILIACFPLTLGSALAEEVQIEITGEIYNEPCKINNDASFEINFGKVSIQEVDGNKFKQTKTVEVLCVNNSGVPYISFTSNTGVQGENILKTTGVNASSLGIALYQGDSVDSRFPLKVNVDKDKIKKGLSQINTERSHFTFTAAPYKYGSEALTAGTFSATATMNIFYV